MAGMAGTFSFGSHEQTLESLGTSGRRPSVPSTPQYDDKDEAEKNDHDLQLRRSRSRKSTKSSSAPTTAVNGGDIDDTEKMSSSEDSDEESRRRDEEVHTLARRMTTRTMDSHTGNPDELFTTDENSPLNPNGPNFNARAWAKAMIKLGQQSEHHAPRATGICFQNLSAHGYGQATDFQKTLGNVWIQMFDMARSVFHNSKRRIDILQNFDGVVQPGEMLVVLGPPGSGCSTFLKTIAGETHGFTVDDDSYINYQGISAQKMHSNFRGEAIYTAEVDVHFPMLSVGDTLTFASRARAPRHTPGGLSREEFADHLRDVTMAMFGISHTINTRVGNDYIRGVSGGERKRVTISEAALSAAPLQCWDNSTRGLDSANAIEFCKTLRMESELFNTTACVAIYQAPQSAYDMFDKAIVLYEGRQIYFGRTTEARAYFEKIGFQPRPRQTDADFLTSMTSAAERVVRSGFEGRAPRTPDEFAAVWKNSEEYKALQVEIEEFKIKHPIDGEDLARFKESRRVQQARNARPGSPYTLSYGQQVKLCLWRGFQRLKGDPSLTVTQLFGNSVMALIIGSVFYNLQDDTNSFFQRGALLFFAVLMNAFGSALEILTLYAQRPIVEKHSRYAFYHPSAEAFASMLTDMPYKIGNAILFNLILYFMTNLRREPGAFFFFLFTSFLLTITMSMVFRGIASMSRSLTQAMPPASILMLALVIYTGFTIPTDYMLGWARWINYLDPISYGFESLMINEFHDRNFTCSVFVPSGGPYNSVSSLEHICSAVGAAAGANYVNGDTYIYESYKYTHSHKWRNIGILFAFIIGLAGVYLVAAELVSEKKSKGEVLVFRRGYRPAALKESPSDDEAAAPGTVRRIQTGVTEKDVQDVIQKQTAVFHWKDVCYDIKIKGEPRRILDHVDGWVKPGTLTALMGVSGAGKTTLLDVLATRVTMGVISGEMLVDGQPRDASFQRKTGYVQQQDLHLATSTVREALTFSALLRQPAHVPRAEKIAYVDQVIKILEMEEYSEAVVGVPGEGLNVEQRKRLTIGVELAAKPQLLLFLDEPTSGLDSQTSWIICDLMEKLTKSGQAILCTIHQPSALLFQRFDRLLFLAKGGKTVYFGEVGENSHILIDYFQRNGGSPCPPGANPAEWMLEVIGAAPGSHTDIDWFQTWRDSPEYRVVHAELEHLKESRPLEHVPTTGTTRKAQKAAFREFAAPFGEQLLEVTRRVFQQYYRTPTYLYAKMALVGASGLFVGFSFFNAKNSQQGLQNQMFSIFMLMTTFNQLVQQIMPHFVTQRSLYEVRERPSKAYSWKVFMLSNIIVELPWNTLAAIVLYFCWYYPTGLYRNAEPTDAVTLRGAQMFLLIWAFLLFTSTFTNMVIAAIETAETGGNIAQLLFSLSLVFCGVLATPTALPGFWIFMYRVSPFTYLVSAMLSVAVAGTDVKCATNEYLHFSPPSGQTCGDYMSTYMSAAGGYLQDSNATDSCSFCSIADTDTFLASVNSYYSDSWRNFGIMWAYIIFNACAALFLYWLARVPKGKKEKKEEEKKA